MKSFAPALVALAAFGAMALVQPGSALAQQGPVTAKVSNIEVSLTKTPRLSVEAGTKEKRDTQREWLEVEVEFQAEMGNAKDEYVNELEFSYHVYFKSDAKVTTIYTANVIHVNIPVKETTYSSIYVSPTTLGKIFGKDKKVNPNDVWVAVEVKSQGAVKGGMANQKESTKWWQSPNASRVDGMLLNKSQTPFAFLWWDRYPEVRNQR